MAVISKVKKGKLSEGLTEKQKGLVKKHFLTLAGELVSRTSIIDKLGKSYQSASKNRDLYKSLGYLKEPTFLDYFARYKRQDIAKAVVEALPLACWRLKPQISDSDEMDSKFEMEIRDIIRDVDLWYYLSRVDKIAGIGQFGILLIGVDDGKPLSEPLVKAKQVIYLRPYMQNHVEIELFVNDIKDRRYGLPLLYSIDTADGVIQKVHFSRVIHVCEGAIEDDVYGTPRLEPILNRLQDVELVSGGSAEMFWRGAFPGLAFKAEPDAQFNESDLEDFEGEIQDYLQDLRRYLRLQGVTIQELAPQVADPASHIDVFLTLISAATRIPKRILLGSERGELASTQDERSWIDRIEERRTGFCESVLVRPFVDLCISSGIISPPPSDNYVVEWPSLVIQGDKDKAIIAKEITTAVALYVSTPGLIEIIPPEIYLEKYLEFSTEEINQAKELLGKELGKSDEETEDIISEETVDESVDEIGDVKDEDLEEQIVKDV